MSFGRIENYFESMRRTMEIRFIIPDDQRFRNQPDGSKNPYYERKTKVMVLLNGYTHNNLEWLMNTKAAEFALKYNVAIFMPSGENGFYVNHEGTNEHFGDFVGEELIAYVAKCFHLSEKREDHFVLGISMGGFGALHTGLAYPQSYSKIVALSSALILYEIAGAKPGFENAGGDYWYYRRTFGDLDTLMTSQQNPEQLIREMKEEHIDIPKIFMACGSEDFLLEHNQRFEKFLTDEKVDHVYYQSPGIHDYDFWNQYVEKAFRWCLGIEEA